MTSGSRLDFVGNPINDEDAGILKNKNNSRYCGMVVIQQLLQFFEVIVSVTSNKW